MHLRFLSALLLVCACGGRSLLQEDDAGDGGASDPGGNQPDDGDDGSGSSEPQTPPPECEPALPLEHGDAEWALAPFSPPGDDKPDDGDDDDGEGGDGGGGAFISEPDGGGSDLECDIWGQDCAYGEKCMPWANDGGTSWNALKCSPLDPNPFAPGESCTVEGSPVSGVDDCDGASMCWGVDQETLEGECTAFCIGPPSNPTCVDPATTCAVFNDGVLPLCLLGCDPTVQSCPQGDACVGQWAAAGFVCVIDASGAEGQYGDACEYINSCDPGLYCANSDVVPGCVGSLGCCSEYCDLGDPDASGTCSGFLDGQVCVPWYEEGTAPDGLDHVGGCALPDGPPDGGRSGERRDCPDTYDPVVLYMSNDDSNSQASPILARRRIREGMVIFPDQVRIHEFLNYYDLSYENPDDVPARVGIQMRRTSVERGEFTLLLYAQGRKIEDDERPPFNLVFSLDTSGSMSGEPLELLKESMRALAGNLREGDVISMVTWNHTQSVMLDGLHVSGPGQPELMAAIEGLHADGSTDLHSGLVTAYELADAHRISNGINRVVLISDGGANTGITDIDIIAAAASDENGECTYLVGVGVGSAGYYSDSLMDEVTDAGKGAYLFIDEAAEAERMFGERFLSNVAVAARDVRMELTMPWYFGMKSFHGEEYSPIPEEVEPQHLAPNDAMSFHQIVDACDPSLVLVCEEIKARVDYKDPITREEMSDEVTMELGDLVRADATQLRKADAIVSYAKSLIVIGSLVEEGRGQEAVNVAANMKRWLRKAALDLQDIEIAEIANLMQEYDELLRQQYG